MPHSNVNYSHHVLHDVPGTYLSYNWEFVHFHPAEKTQNAFDFSRWLKSSGGIFIHMADG